MKRFLGQIELFVRHILVYPLLRIVLRNKEITLPIDITKVSSVLILRYDKIGDMIVTIPIFRILKRRNPGLRIGVVTSEANLEILEGEPTVDERFVLFRNPFKLCSELMRLRRVGYEVVINFIFNRTTSGGLIANVVCPTGVKVGQGAETYRFYFNALISLPRATIHMFEILVLYVEQVFGFTIAEEEKRLRIEITDRVKADVDLFLEQHHLIRRVQNSGSGSRYIVLNISAREWNKRMSHNQAAFLANQLAQQPKITTVVTSAPEDARARDAIVSGTNSIRCIRFPDSRNATMHEMTSLVEGALCVITPDTSIIHVASSTSTPVLGLFTPLQVNQEWLPYKTKSSSIVSPIGRPVADIPLQTLQNALEEFLALSLKESGREIQE